MKKIIEKLNIFKLNDLSIRAKLLRILLWTNGIALVIAGLAIVAHDVITFRQQRVSDLSSQAAIISAISSAALVFNDSKAAQEYLSSLKERSDITAAVIYDKEGKVFASYRRSDDSLKIQPLAESDGYRFEHGHLLLFRAIRDAQEKVGTIHLRTSLNIETRILSYAAIVFFVLLGSFLIASILSRRLQEFVLTPLLEVTQVAKEVIAKQDYSSRVIKQTNDEVGVLVDAFNQMLDQIQQREAALQVEVTEHRLAKEEVTSLNQNLEKRVAERTIQLEAVNKELEAFAYSVSHDLRAPLRSIDGFTAILQETYIDKLDEQGQHYFQRIRAATQRMGRLIDDLLNLSRTVRSQMHLGTVNLTEIAQSIIKDLQEAAPERKVIFSIKPDMIVHADVTLIRTVLENLLGNAWKFTGKCLEAMIEMGATIQDGKTVYFVRDNGAGFDMQFADKLFGTFQRLHAMTEFEGTGVGLANVQRIVHRHGGTIWADAALDRGATFFFTLESESVS